MKNRHPIHSILPALALFGASQLQAQATAGEVANWTVLQGAPVVSNASTNSPTFGDGTVDQMDGVTVASTFGTSASPATITLAVGETLTVSASVTLTGGLDTAGNYRFGIQDDGGQLAFSDPNLWNGGWTYSVGADLYAARTDGHFLSTFANAVDLNAAKQSSGALDGASATPYAFRMTVTRDSATTVDLVASFVGGDGNLIEVYSVSDLTTSNFTYTAFGIQTTGNVNLDQLSLTDVSYEVTSELITYVDAQEGPSGNTYATVGGSLADTAWIDTVTNGTIASDLWMKRSGGAPGWTEHNGTDTIQSIASGFPNSIPEITTEVPGLPDGIYEVWVFFWEQTDSGSQNWGIDASLTPGSQSSYSSPAGPISGTDSSSPAIANTLPFSNAPAFVAAGGNQSMFGVNLGETPVGGGSSIEVFVDKLSGTGTNSRTIYDGIGYRYVGPLPALPPELVSTDPVDDELEVQVGQNLVANFDLPVQPGTGAITLKRTSNNATVETFAVTDVTPPGTVTFSGTTVTIDPTDDLEVGVGYYVIIDSGAIESTAGAAFSGITVAGDWSFTTDGTPPTITATEPMNAEIGIQRSIDLTLSFDEDVLAVGGKSITIHLQGGSAVETIDASAAMISGGQVTIPVSIDLGLGNAYYVTIEAGAFTDFSENPYAGIAGSSAWTFTTALSDITYVDAISASNTYATGSILTDVSWVGPDVSTNSDTQWNERTGLESNGDFLYQASSDTTPVPELTTEITGLADGVYTIWGFYWDQVTSNSQNWVLSAGLTSGSLTTYSSPGEPAVSGATTTGVTNAAALAFTSIVSVEAGFDITESIFVRNLFGVAVGQVEVSGGATVSVYIGSNLATGTGNRTWYDGVGYQLIGTPPPGGTFSDWIGGFPGVGLLTGVTDDADGDGIDNGVENFFGTNPSAFSQGLVSGTVDTGAGTFTFTHPINATPASDLTATYRWSKDLATFTPDGIQFETTTVTFSPGTPAGGFVTVTATVTGTPLDKLFVDVEVTQD